MKILFVDDDPRILKRYGDIFRNNGHICIEIQENNDEGEEAIEFLINNEVDLILIDHLLSAGYTGVDLVRKINEIEKHDYTPKVILTNTDSSKLMRSYLTEYNLDSYVNKTELHKQTCEKILSKIFSLETVQKKLKNNNEDLRILNSTDAKNKELMKKWIESDIDNLLTYKREKNNYEKVVSRLNYINSIVEFGFKPVINNINKFDFLIQNQIPLEKIKTFQLSIDSQDHKKSEELREKIFKNFSEEERKNAVQVYFKLKNKGNYTANSLMVMRELTKHPDNYSHIIKYFKENFISNLNNKIRLGEKPKANLFIENILFVLVEEGKI